MADPRGIVELGPGNDQVTRPAPGVSKPVSKPDPSGAMLEELIKIRKATTQTKRFTIAAFFLAVLAVVIAMSTNNAIHGR